MMTNSAIQQKTLIQMKEVGVNYRNSLNIWSRKDIWALKQVTFEVRAGETLGIIGKNGAGKSTLLKLLAGIIEPDVGLITRNVRSVMLLSLQVGFLPQLSGRENAILSGILLGMRKLQVTNSMEEIIEFSGLQEYIDYPVRTYSSGMKARLGFAVACQADPDVLLVDEVLGVGDASFNEKSKKLMVDKINSDKTVVIVSHNESTIEQYCDRVVLIDKGESILEGSPAEVFAAYKNVGV